ncbi:MAG: PilZ domain-containing protein [Thermoanaerobaculales bacterium]|nr:PilZ domain-containing protein [Thermoanaerobaculales bacterium]
MDERRQHQRYDVKRPIKGSVKPRMEIRVVNISEGGLMVEAPFGLPPAGICELTLNLPNGEMVIKVKVARCRANMVKTATGGTAVVFHAGLTFGEKLAGSPEIKALIAKMCSLKNEAEMTGQVTLHEELEQAM